MRIRKYNFKIIKKRLIVKERNQKENENMFGYKR